MPSFKEIKDSAGRLFDDLDNGHKLAEEAIQFIEEGTFEKAELRLSDSITAYNEATKKAKEWEEALRNQGLSFTTLRRDMPALVAQAYTENTVELLEKLQHALKYIREGKPPQSEGSKTH